MSDLELDSLFKEVRRTAHVHKEAAKKFIEPPPETQSVFANPDNWTRTRGIALIHGPTQTLLGNFWEWKHKTVADARRLVRCKEPIPVSAVEEVDFGYFAPTPIAPSLDTSIRREVRVEFENLILEFPPCVGTSIPVIAHTVDAYLDRVTLAADASFVTEEEVLFLPAGVNILPVMSRDDKVFIRSHL